MLVHFLLLLCLSLSVMADKTVIIDGADPSIVYSTGDNTNTTYPTWLTIQRSADSCDTPQQLTERPGDYATFTFTGTGVMVLGTVGVKRGILGFSFDGQNVTVDRTRTALQCDYVLFQKLGLPNQQHTVVVTLLEKQPSMVISGAPLVGVLSIQRIRYTLPGSDKSGPGTGVIAGAAAGGVVLLIALLAAFWFIRKRRLAKATRGGNTANLSDVDSPSNPQMSSIGLSTAPHPPITPFVMNQGDDSSSLPYRQSMQSPARTPDSAQPLMWPYGAPSTPNSPNLLLSPRSEGSNNRYSDIAPSVSGGSSGNNNQDGYFPSTGQYILNNPDNRTSMPPARHSSGQDTSIVDQIAHRVADIMTSRQSMPVMDLAPPQYDQEHASSSVAKNIAAAPVKQIPVLDNPRGSQDSNTLPPVPRAESRPFSMTESVASSGLLGDNHRISAQPAMSIVSASPPASPPLVLSEESRAFTPGPPRGAQPPSSPSPAPQLPSGASAPAHPGFNPYLLGGPIAPAGANHEGSSQTRDTQSNATRPPFPGWSG